VQKQISEIEKLNARVIAISTTGDQDDVKSTKNSLRITYTFIPTPNRKVGEDFNLTYDRGAAFATIIIDKNGRIRYRGVDRWDRRTSVSQIIKEPQDIQ
jgi:peroxiredoxin